MSMSLSPSNFPSLSENESDNNFKTEEHISISAEELKPLATEEEATEYNATVEH